MVQVLRQARWLFIACLSFLVACSSKTPLTKAPELYFKQSTLAFIDLNETRRNGAVVDKGLFYPKDTYSFTYRYCAVSPESALNDIAEYQQLAKRTCDANGGKLVHQQTGTWCVNNANTSDEFPIFYARISSTELWADLCLDGPFVTLRVVENTNAPADEWLASAKVLGYQPYTATRQLVSSNDSYGQLYQAPATPVEDIDMWDQESLYIYNSPGQTVCLYNQENTNQLGHTYQGVVENVNLGKVRVLVTRKLKGDIRTAPTLELQHWHDRAYITAPAQSWFVCG
ncbi:hypothetical protein A3K86_15275 [Photobacterium jeanii]|uniref:Lipoprotein n=1 Tax=Photobacterium jeanii TaxID=858640 RepID=A0A178K7I2_9GAMM|nr:hypothetical protein [Photobacterium jeanii]OAN13026.1 hypothetical protein A3K86_15275 [Photobacterium jeanii]PST89175.1 hypothetical protein C9I91_13720 [Photobacterium jeanii]